MLPVEVARVYVWDLLVLTALTLGSKSLLTAEPSVRGWGVLWEEGSAQV